MKKFRDYNIANYLESIMGMRPMLLEAILSKRSPCEQYRLDPNVSEYLHYVGTEPFYIAPSFSDVKTNNRVSTLNPKFILFSAPGATGKSSLAKHVSYKLNALYWNLAKLKLGTNSFAGSILSAVSASSYSKFISDLNESKMMLVIDAIDEAEIISGRKMVSNFIVDISNSLTDYNSPNVVLFARTETAQYLASFCAENQIPVAHYEIGFFLEGQAKEFVEKSVVGKNGTPTIADNDCINRYYNVIKANVTPEECNSFLGYAPVLEAIAEHIKASPNRAKLLSELSEQTDCVSIVMKIMNDLLIREKEEKVISAFKGRCEESHSEFTDWDILYSTEEQLVRLVSYVLFNDTKYLNYPIEGLPPQLIDDYQEMLDRFLPQHPFVRNSFEGGTTTKNNIDFTGPAFRDYTLAELILNDGYSDLAHIYFEESHSQHFFPSQVFFDCYTNIVEGIVKSNHLSYVYESYRAKATAMERPYMQCAEVTSSQDDPAGVLIFGMLTGKHSANRGETVLDMAIDGDELSFDQVSNISIHVPSLAFIVGSRGVDARISNSSIVCRQIIWNTDNVVIESYPPEGTLMVSHEPISGNMPTIDIAYAENLRISAPNIKDYYRLISYRYDFENVSEIDITKFTHAMRCIMIEFRTHKKDTLAKAAERIDNVTVGNNPLKQKVLDYMKFKGMIYPEAHLYKVNTLIIQELGISYSALFRMDIKQMEAAFTDFCTYCA